MKLRTLLVLASLALLAAVPGAAQMEADGPEFPVNTNQVARQKAPSVFFENGGRYTVVWENDRLGVRCRRFRAVGPPLGPDFSLVLNSQLPPVPGEGPMVYNVQPAVVRIAGGPGGAGFLLFWTREDAYLRVAPFIQHTDVLDRKVYGQRFNPAGQPLGEPFAVDPTANAFQSHPRAALGQGGRVLVVWEHDAQGEASDVVLGRLFDTDGNALGPVVPLSETVGARPAVAAADDGRFLVVWEGPDDDDEGVFLRLLGPDGGYLTAPAQANTSTEGPQRRAAVAAHPEGGFLVAWNGRYESRLQARIFGRQLDADGAFAGPERRFSDGDGTAQVSPFLAPTLGGGFLVAWIDWEESFPIGVFGIQVDAAGLPVGEAMAFNDDPVNSHFFASVAGDGAGRFVAVWEGFTGQEAGIKAKAMQRGSGGQAQMELTLGRH